MSLTRIFRYSSTEQIEEQNVMNKLKNNLELSEKLRSIFVETCFYIESTLPKNPRDGSSVQLEKDLDVIRRLLHDPWATSSEDSINGLATCSRIAANAPKNPMYPQCFQEIVFEIGPRTAMVSPFSTNCVNICKALNIHHVVRIEQAKRYRVFATEVMLTKADNDFILRSLCDPMIQASYVDPLTSLTDSTVAAQEWTIVRVLTSGRDALIRASEEMNLGFDETDVNQYYHLFRNVLKRDPTNVELFDLAQSNSEHSRHWFFKGIYIIDGVTKNKCLLQMVMETNPDQGEQNPAMTQNNSLIKFSDNSSCIRGYQLNCFVRQDCMQCGPYKMVDLIQHIIFTAETHNFPTGIAPFSGSTTGVGGRIRDVQAAGRGGRVIAGTAGYCVGNLLIEDYIQSWEDEFAEYSEEFARPLHVLLRASDGASDYGNKFGEPLICGFTRSYGQVCLFRKERREWIKPIMFSGGIGTIDHKYLKKMPPKKDHLVVKIGGPAYRIGVGGGAASSMQTQGGRKADIYGAVQRGDPEMGQKLNRVVRGCLEMQHGDPSRCSKNPIEAIHDQGAGGNANVIKEIVDGKGANIFINEFSVGDDTLSVLELWSAEYQESNAVLVSEANIKNLKHIATREKCPLDVVGYVIDKRMITFACGPLTRNVNKPAESYPVRLNLEAMASNLPRRTFHLSRISNPGLPMVNDVTDNDWKCFRNLLRDVLRLPSVGSKRYLTTKVDRSVTGLVAQQQCVGPLQLPLADVAVIALDYFTERGAATSIGEQPIKMLIDPRAGARMTVIEALTNLCSCHIESLESVKCSANWMWPAKMEGEGAAMFEACEAMCELMVRLKIGVDGGKDSLSMASSVSDDGFNVVKSPGSLVISAYAPVPDIYKKVTPDLKCGHLNWRRTPGHLWLVKPAMDCFRIGGSAFMQVRKQTGDESPDLNPEQVKKFADAFNAIQELIRDGHILALHDISDGGLITCLIEMAIAGNTGLNVQLPVVFVQNNDPYLKSIEHYLSAFNEEAGWVLEVAHDNPQVRTIFEKYNILDEVYRLGQTLSQGANERVIVKYKNRELYNNTVRHILAQWDETCLQLEKLQINKNLAAQEQKSMIRKRITPMKTNLICDRNFVQPGINAPLQIYPIVAIVREEGCNGDREMAAAFFAVGFQVLDITMWDILHNPTLDISMFNGIVFPGGFSYADVLGSATGWAAVFRENPAVSKAMMKWKNTSGNFSLGVCNGFQLMVKMGWLNPVPPPKDSRTMPSPKVRLGINSSGRFECRWLHVTAPPSRAMMLKGMETNVFGVWSAHSEGRVSFADNETFHKVKSGNLIALQYANDLGQATNEYPDNPNGSKNGIAAICSPDGNHLGIMPHPERSIFCWQCPYDYDGRGLTPWKIMFENAYNHVMKAPKKKVLWPKGRTAQGGGGGSKMGSCWKTNKSL